MGWTLAAIRRKVRQVTGRLNPDVLSTPQLDDYINDYYIYTFPAEVKLERQHTYYTFNTSPNVRLYTFPSTTYTNIEPPFYLNGNKIDYYQEPALFFANNPEQYQLSSFASGDGATVAFTTTLTGIPIEAGSVIVTDNTEIFTDDGAGVLTGDDGGSGTVNYTTGAIAVTFAAAPTDGQAITARWLTYQAGTPTAVLYYNNQFRFAPIPDTVYPCRVKSYLIVTAFSAATDTPVNEEWGPAIAYGAAREIHANFGEIDRYQEVTALYKEQIDYILTRTAQNLLNQRTLPSF